MALSLVVISAIMSIYVISLSIDNKTIRFSRLNDEVGNLMALLGEDIKRAGYVNDAEDFYINNTRSDANFRDITVGNFSGEPANSCILFSYDRNRDGAFSQEGFGYRLRDKAIEARQAGNNCTQANWQDLTDPKFVEISRLSFNCQVTTNAVTLACTDANLPPALGSSSTINITFGFTATLVADVNVSVQSSETVMVRNASYN